MKLLIQRLILFGGVLVSLQVRGDAPESEDKRSISALAREGQLPSPGKRYVAALAKNGELTAFTRPSWKKKLHQILQEAESDYNENISEQKRYVGALAKTGDLKVTKLRNDKRDEVDTLIDELMTAEELRRLRLEALREELLREHEEQSEDVEEAEEKRSLSSLARTGSMPFTQGKRGISSLAKNDDFPWSDGKRGGIASLMRTRLHRKRNYVNELNDLIDELSEDENNYEAQTAKRNLASFAKSGGLSGLSYRNEKKDLYEDWERPEEDSKRNIQSLLRNRMSPLVEGKRYLGAFFASNGRPPYISRDPNFKRNIGSMAKGWRAGDGFRMGKREADFDQFENEEADDIAKRYVAALLRQGRLPVGNDATNLENAQEDLMEPESKEEVTGVEEEKRHIGSIAAQSSYAMRKKKSVDLNEQKDEAKVSEKQTDHTNENDVTSTRRTKREIYYDSSEEYPMPVLQNTVTSDYEDIMSKVSGDGPSARNKRYFGALARNGWLPAGYYRGTSKRHIGALARLGWLPSFRSSRGYSRFGRDVRSPCKRSSSRWWEDSRREATADWESQGFPQPEFGQASRTLDTEDKRFLLLPALDNMLLRQMYSSRQH
ncbi:neuropeptide-like precursor 1 isoform X2 [Lycorma delicatula]|uniref:neuropeptide-like precursor 1 isoform X2 n=1 Tax=Lycorma delicatula TaxID=130591 RepID=UPI003F51858B